jgi:hypothetical protein
MQRFFSILIAGLLTGLATEVGKEVVASEQLHRAISSMLGLGQAEPGHRTPATTPRPQMPPDGSPASNRPRSAPDGPRRETAPVRPPTGTARVEADRHLYARLKCKWSEETPWQYDSDSYSVIWKCIDRRYFAFQCSANELALVTYGVDRLRIAEFFRYEHLAGHEPPLVAWENRPYYYYPLTRRLFALFSDAPFVSLFRDNGDVLYLDLTSLKRLSNIAFSECMGA